MNIGYRWETGYGRARFSAFLQDQAGSKFARMPESWTIDC